MKQYGFKILDMPEVQRCDNDRRYQWRRVNAFDFSIETHPNCPIDGSALETIAALVGLGSNEVLRVGACPRCGIVGYIDRPSAAEIDRYYAETWMGETLEAAIHKANEAASQRPDVSLLESLPVPKDMPVLEIGCGYGRTVHALKCAGFTEVYATERCPVRAQATGLVHGIRVTTEIPDKRYGLILSSHVLEHLCDPAALIRECAKRQEQGDWMVHSLPNYIHEPAMGILLFLPHLWSFMPWTLTEMLERSGYSHTGHDGSSVQQLCYVVQKLQPPTTDPCWKGGPLLRIATDKLLRGLSLVQPESRVTWFAGRDGAAWLPRGVMQAMQDGVLQRSLMAWQVTEFRTSAPIELQYESRIEMYVK